MSELPSHPRPHAGGWCRHGAGPWGSVRFRSKPVWTLKYAAQYGNESGNNAETDRFKAYWFAARYETNPGFTTELMLAQFKRDKDADRTTAQGLAGYRGKNGRVGAQYSFQKRRPAADSTADDINLDVISGFGVWDVKRQKAPIFARVDRFADPCADCSGIDYLPVDTKEAFTLTIAEVEYYLLPSVRFSPNVEWVIYSTPPSTSTTKPKDDLVGRLTFYWTWQRGEFHPDVTRMKHT